MKPTWLGRMRIAGLPFAQHLIPSISPLRNAGRMRSESLMQFVCCERRPMVETPREAQRYFRYRLTIIPWNACVSSDRTHFSVNRHRA